MYNYTSHQYNCRAKRNYYIILGIIILHYENEINWENSRK